jgi:transposase
MSEPEHLPTLSREALLALVAELRRQLAELTSSPEALRAEIDRLKRGGKPQAAPFSTGIRVAEPKPPGRKPGSGTFCSQQTPSPAEINAPPVDVQVTLAACPACGGPLAAAHVLPYGVGSPVRKVPAVLATLTGVRRTQGAFTQDVLRRTAGPVGTAYEPLRAAVPEAPGVLHTDDTGWRVGSQPAHLMAFETEAATGSQVRPRHRHEEVQELIPAAYAGGMVTDRGRSYDAQAFDRVDQQKGLAHILRSSSAVVATQTSRARDFGEQRKALVQEALALWHAHHDGQVTDFTGEAEALQAERIHQRRDRRLQEPDKQRRRNERGWPHDRGNGRRFLTDPRIEPTTNRAERALRPAVLARKVSHGSQNERGAQAFAAFMSVVRTLAKHSAEVVVAGLDHLFRTSSLQGAPP